MIYHSIDQLRFSADAKDFRERYDTEFRQRAAPRPTNELRLFRAAQECLLEASAHSVRVACHDYRGEAHEDTVSARITAAPAGGMGAKTLMLIRSETALGALP